MPTFSLSSPESLASQSGSNRSSSSSLASNYPPNGSSLWRASGSRKRGRDDDNPPIWSLSRYISHKSPVYQARRSIAVVLILICAVAVFFAPPPSSWSSSPASFTFSNLPISPIRPAMPASSAKQGPDPEKWLQENSNDKHAVTGPGFTKLMQSSKPKAALISLVRNQELDGIIQSMTQLEYHWNHKYQYPWIFFNDEPFNDEFKVR